MAVTDAVGAMVPDAACRPRLWSRMATYPSEMVPLQIDLAMVVGRYLSCSPPNPGDETRLPTIGSTKSCNS
jgi:hypothetical protein